MAKICVTAATMARPDIVLEDRTDKAICVVMIVETRPVKVASVAMAVKTIVN